jgi:hypothetical protein
MLRTAILTAGALALGLASAAAQTETVIVRGSRDASSPDICLRIADAKVKEWAQARVLRDRTDVFADGTTRRSEFIFTENGVYFRVRDLWQTGQVARAQRRADDARSVAQRMALSDCSVDAADEEDGQAVTHYVYSQGPDAAGELWVLDATGLPLRMAVRQKPEKPDQPVTVELRYSYNDAVKVPDDAQLTAIMRQRRSRDMLTSLQLHHAAW